MSFIRFWYITNVIFAKREPIEIYDMSHHTYNLIRLFIIRICNGNSHRTLKPKMHGSFKNSIFSKWKILHITWPSLTSVAIGSSIIFDMLSHILLTFSRLASKKITAYCEKLRLTYLIYCILTFQGYLNIPKGKGYSVKYSKLDIIFISWIKF